MIKLIGGVIQTIFVILLVLGAIINIYRGQQFLGQFLFIIFLCLVPGSIGVLLIRNYFTEKKKFGLDKNKQLAKERGKEILSLAKQKAGCLNVLDIVTQTSMSIEEAEDMMKELLEKGYIRKEATNSGDTVYYFPGIGTQRSQNNN